MTRISTLLPAFVLVFAVTGANLAMAANAGTDKPDHSTSVHQSVAHDFKTTTKAATSDPTPCTAGQAICSSEGY